MATGLYGRSYSVVMVIFLLQLSNYTCELTSSGLIPQAGLRIGMENCPEGGNTVTGLPVLSLQLPLTT